MSTAEWEQLYASGLSLRDVEKVTGASRETVRKHLIRKGLLRGRLEMRRAKPSGSDNPERVLQYVAPPGPNGCWLWTASINNMGYGVTRWRGRGRAAHRVVYEILRERIPDGLDACHRCDTPGCVNPDHIFIGTRSENMQDAKAKGRLRRGEAKSNAKLTETQILSARALEADGISLAEAARRVGAPYKVLHAAVRGRSWRHLSLQRAA